MDTKKFLHHTTELLTIEKYGEALERYDVLLTQLADNTKTTIELSDKLEVWNGYITALGALGYHGRLINWIIATLVNEPKWLNGKAHLIAALVETGNLKQGLEYFGELDGLPPTSYTVLAAGSALSAIGNSEDAQKIFAAALVSATENAPDFGVAILISFIETIAREQDEVGATEEKIRYLLNASDPSVFRYQIARYCKFNDVTGSFRDEPRISAKAADDDRYLRLYSGRSRRIYNQTKSTRDFPTFVTPIINPESLETNIEKFFNLVSQLLDVGWFSSQLDNIKDMKSAFGPDTEDPVIVLSTGRCGTKSLNLFFETSPFLESYHTMHLVLAPCERNHLLYRLITGNFDEQVVASILKLYLESRTAEFVSAYRVNKTPIIVNHWDTIFAPFIAAIFPQSRFLYLKRDEVKVGRSQIMKNQWRNRQLQHWRFDPNFTNGEFSFTRDETLPLAAEISWYLRITEVFSLAFMRTIDDERSIEILSEDLFERSENVYVGLCKWLPSAKFSRESYDDIFGAVHNEKNEFIAYTDSTVDRLSTSLIEYLDKLKRYGGFIT